MDENQNQKSSVDRANDFINNAKGIYQKGKQAKKTLQAIRITRAVTSLGQGLGMGSILTIAFASLLLATLFIGLIGGGAITGTSEDQGDAPVEEAEFPGVDIDYTVRPPNPENGVPYQVKIFGTFDEGKSEGRTLEDLKIVMTASDTISISGLPHGYSTKESSTLKEYTWLLNVSEIRDSIFTQVADSDPPVYNFEFNLTVTPLDIDTYGTITFTFEEVE